MCSKPIFAVLNLWINDGMMECSRWPTSRTTSLRPSPEVKVWFWMLKSCWSTQRPVNLCPLELWEYTRFTAAHSIWHEVKQLLLGFVWLLSLPVPLESGLSRRQRVPFCFRLYILQRLESHGQVKKNDRSLWTWIMCSVQLDTFSFWSHVEIQGLYFSTSLYCIMCP